MNGQLTQDEIARLRVITAIEMHGSGYGVIEAGGRTFRISFRDLLDVVQAVESIMLKLTGKVLNRKFVPALTNRDALAITALQAGGPDIYDGALGESPEPEAHYMRVEIGETRWDQWFTRLDELIKCLYNIVREAQQQAAPVAIH